MGDGDPAFLSEAWFEVLGSRLRDRVGADAAPLRLGVVITSVPEGASCPGQSDEVRYTLVLGGGTPSTVVVGSVDGAEVVVVESYEDALALAGGSVSAGELLEGGRITLRGDAGRLVEAADTLAAAVAASQPC